MATSSISVEEILKILSKLAEDSESVITTVNTTIKKYKPIVYRLLNELLKIYKDYSNNTEYPAIKAKVARNMFLAYINAGFSEEQAMALMLNDNLKLTENMKNVSTSTNNVKG